MEGQTKKIIQNAIENTLSERGYILDPENSEKDIYENIFKSFKWLTDEELLTIANEEFADDDLFTLEDIKKDLGDIKEEIASLIMNEVFDNFKKYNATKIYVGRRDEFDQFCGDILFARNIQKAIKFIVNDFKDFGRFSHREEETFYFREAFDDESSIDVDIIADEEILSEIEERLKEKE